MARRSMGGRTILLAHPSRQQGIHDAAILSFALKIGANTAIFTLLHAALWKPLPVPRPGEIFHVSRSDGKEDRCGYSWVLYQELREAAQPYGAILARSSTGRRRFAI